MHTGGIEECLETLHDSEPLNLLVNSHALLDSMAESRVSTVYNQQISHFIMRVTSG